MNEKVNIVPLDNPAYKKCECCGNVRDIFFKMTVFDSKTGKKLVGDFSLCKKCGENFSDILNLEVETDLTTREFSFSKS